MKKTSQAVVFKVGPERSAFALYRYESPLRTPAGEGYVLPTAALAEAIAAEWQAQQEWIGKHKPSESDPAARRKAMAHAMPMTQLAATAIDIVARERGRVVGQLTAHASTELLCYRAEAPAALAGRQHEIWQPYLDWCAERFGALLTAGTGVMPVRQSAKAILALQNAVQAYDRFFLAGLGSAVDTTGSLVLGLALTEGARNAGDIFEAAELDANHQRAEWGDDPVTQSRRKSIRQELLACEKWFGLLRG